MNTYISHSDQTLHTADSLRTLEQQLARTQGFDMLDLMERAGQAVFACARANWPEARLWCVVCGTGNNGGDGYVVARLARLAGYDTVLIRVGESTGPGEAVAARAAFLDCGGIESPFATLRSGLRPDLIIDALFGIGLNRAPGAAASEVIEWINARAVPVLSIDTPSGLNADSAATPGACVKATMTLALIALKRGLFTGRALEVVGRVRLVQLIQQIDETGDDVVKEGSVRLIHVDEVQALFPSRPRDAHKGRFGHVLVMGGDEGMGGAALLAAESALRCGAGWVSLATRATHVAASLARCPEVMVHAVNAPSDVQPLLERADVIALGPGLGQSDWSRAMLSVAIRSGKRLVLDADALNLIAADSIPIPEDTVITPHPGEAARLLSTSTSAIESDRYAAVRALQQRYGGVAVLKGAGSLICDSRGIAVCDRGNPGMASAGMGDVLAGIIAALRAQGLAAFDAARAGVWAHASAGDRAARSVGERGMVARDVIAWLPRMLNA